MEENQTNSSYIEEPFEVKFTRFASRVVNIAPLLAGIGIIIWWLFQGTIGITKVELTFEQRVGLTICVIVVALTYRKLISMGGFKDAMKTEEYTKTDKEWKDEKDKVKGKRDACLLYVKDRCYLNMKSHRRHVLERNDLTYEECFDEEGNFINLNYKHNKYNKKKNPNGYRLHQRLVIRKCSRMRVYEPDVFGLEKSFAFGLRKRKSITGFKAKTDVFNTIVTTVLAFISTGMMFAWLGFSVASFIYALFQVVLWSGSGVLTRLKNYNFIIREIIPQMEENRSIICEFNCLPNERQTYYINMAREQELAKGIKQLTYN